MESLIVLIENFLKGRRHEIITDGLIATLIRELEKGIFNPPSESVLAQGTISAGSTAEGVTETKSD